MSLVLGVDGGNSKTIAMVADDSGRVAGVGRAGCGNHQADSPDAALGEVERAATDALRMAGVERADLDVAFYALAGADLEVDYQILRAAIAAAPLAVCWHLDNDVIAALHSGTENPNAVIVVLGSGTNAAGRNDRGAEIRLAALGWMSGDWGGGGDLAREAIRLAVRSWDGRGTLTQLQEALPAALGLPDIETVITHLHTRQISRERQYALVPIIFETAGHGDPVATELVLQQGLEVATTATTLLRRLTLLDSDADVVLAGSIFRTENQAFLGIINDRILTVAPDVQIVIPGVEPAVGAVLCGMDRAGIAAGPDVRRRLLETSQEVLARMP